MSRKWMWYYPTCLEEVVSLLWEHDDRAVLVAGGTSVCLSPPPRDDLAMIDLSRAKLAQVEKEHLGIRFGAMVTAQELATCESLNRVGAGMLRETGGAIGPRPIRNRVTIGGNVMQAFIWSDLPVSLLAINTVFQIHGPKGTRQLAADELMASHPGRSLERGEVLSNIEVPFDGPKTAGAFLKLSRTAVDHALVSVAVFLSLDDDDQCKTIRVVAGALSPLPQRSESAEELLRNSLLQPDTLKEAADAASTARIINDRRVDADYKQQVLGVLIERAVNMARVRALGETS